MGVADMHVGDQKKVTLSANGQLTIVPHNNQQKWVVRSQVDAKSCSAIIDFNVPGKPGVPPVKLTATLFGMHALADGSNSRAKGRSKLSLEFTDPSGTIAKAGYPVNEWIQ